MGGGGCVQAAESCSLEATHEFLQHVTRSLVDGTFAGLTLSSPTADAGDVERVKGRLVELKAGPHLSITHSAARRDTVENVAVGEVANWLRTRLGTVWRSAVLATTSGDWQLQFSRRGKPRLVRHRASRDAPPPRDHDRQKRSRLGSAAQPWLQALDLVDASGRPRAGRGPKLAQLERYLELLEHLVADLGPDRPPVLRVVDVGSGRGSLTFGAWHLLRNVLRLDADVLGVEARDDLVTSATTIATRLGCDGLAFRTGDVASVDLPAVDVLIALHACDTATDHALRRGFEANARLIVVAPCCHQQIRPQVTAPDPLRDVLRHGILAERLAELATDALRIAWLEDAGYRVKAIEFVGSEHTPKNLMIAAVRAGTSTVPRDPSRYRALRTFFGVGDHALDSASQRE